MIDVLALVGQRVVFVGCETHDLSCEAHSQLDYGTVIGETEDGRVLVSVPWEHSNSVLFVDSERVYLR
jgi:hypothetical protein